jgi:hypothetical protein
MASAAPRDDGFTRATSDRGRNTILMRKDRASGRRRLVELLDVSRIVHRPDFSLAQPRLPQTFSVQFKKRAVKLGFAGFNSTIFAERIRRCYWTAECPCIPLSSGSGTTRR